MEEPKDFVIEDPGTEEKEFKNLPSENREPAEKAAITINIQSWTTPIIAILMLVIGFFAGFYLRSDAASVPEPATVAKVNTPVRPTTDPAVNDQLVAFLSIQERHSLGDPNAPVTIFGFSDFQ